MKHSKDLFTVVDNFHLLKSHHEYISHHTYWVKTKWSTAVDLTASDLLFQLKGEIADLIIYSKIPPNINSTFYYISLDCFAPKANNIPVDRDGLISTFCI